MAKLFEDKKNEMVESQGVVGKVENVKENSMKDNEISFKLGDVDCFEDKGTIWFKLADIAKILDLSDSTTRKMKHENWFDEDEVNTVTKRSGNRGNPNVTYVSESALYSILNQTRATSARKKEELIKSFQEKGYLKEISLCSRKECEFGDFLKDALKPFEIKIIRQFYCKGKHIDFYIPSLRLAIEFDENDHKGYVYENQELRQQMLEDELECTFIRLSDKNSHGYNVGLVLKETFRLTASTS